MLSPEVPGGGGGWWEWRVITGLIPDETEGADGVGSEFWEEAGEEFYVV